MNKMIHHLIRYDATQLRIWDGAVLRARNSHFMFLRGYMEYHGDRFDDCSYMLVRGRKLVALLPAHRQNDDLISHQGLSFGGWILAPECLHSDLDAGFHMLAEDIARQGCKRLIYSPSPYPYHKGSCDDDAFILQKQGAHRHSTRLSAFLLNSTGLPTKRKFRRRLKLGEATSPCVFEETEDLDRFWSCLTAFLENCYSTTPVHNREEMQLLKSLFPNAIRLVVGRYGSEWLIGMVIFLSPQVLRFQYMFQRTDMPRAFLSDRITAWIIHQPDFSRPWIDFGTSLNPSSGELVESLHLHKEILGARGLALNTWIWEP